MPVAEAICPAGISSFFEICDTDRNGNPITDPERIGARGGGFAIARGVRARVLIRKSSKSRIQIRINSKPAPEARTTIWALKKLLAKFQFTLDVRVDIKVSVPIAAGYGTSAAGTMASCVALVDAAGFPITFNEIGRITHIAEVVNRTGLGTASALLLGGFVLVTEPGAPGIGLIDRLRFPEDHLILCVYLGPIPTRNALSQADIATRVNPAAQRAMKSIRRRPDLATFLLKARAFSKEAEFQTPEITRVMDTMMSGGAVGVAQNMIGKAVHGVAEDSKGTRILRAVRKSFSSATTFATKLDHRGARLMG